MGTVKVSRSEPGRKVDPFLAAIGERIRGRRAELRLSLDELAARMGMSKTGLWEVETGKHEPMALTLLALGKALNVSVDWLLTGRSWTEAAAENAKRARELLRELDGLLP